MEIENRYQLNIIKIFIRVVNDHPHMHSNYGRCGILKPTAALWARVRWMRIESQKLECRREINLILFGVPMRADVRHSDRDDVYLLSFRPWSH